VRERVLELGCGLTLGRAAAPSRIGSGKVTPVIDRTFPLSETSEAIRYVGERSTQGKTVITV
jgi:NADPH:quinone reductase-like Zn-dependent oxidoreductase